MPLNTVYVFLAVLYLMPKVTRRWSNKVIEEGFVAQGAIIHCAFGFYLVSVIPIIATILKSIIATIIAWRMNVKSRKNFSMIARHLEASFSHTEDLVAGMAKANLIISGSRALDLFVPGSCTADSDWDFYTYHNPICVGRAMDLLSQSSVIWEDVYEPVRQLLAAQSLLVISISRDSLNEILYRHELQVLQPEECLQPVLDQLRDDAQDLDKNIPVGAHGVLRITPSRKSRSSNYPKVNIITGHTTHNSTRHRVQLIFSKSKSPVELLFGFYSSAVQSCITSFGAVHFYHDLAVRKQAYIWPANTQHRPGADAAMTKYNNRGWTFMRPPFHAQQNRLAKQLTGAGTNGSELLSFRVPLALDPALEAARRRAFAHLAWQECEGATSLLSVTPNDLRDAMAAAKKTRKAARSAGRVDANTVSDATRAIRHSTAFDADTYVSNTFGRIQLPEELAGF